MATAKKTENKTPNNDDMMNETPTGKQSAMIQLGGLWINEPKGGGAKYMSGYLGGAKLLIFRNNYKTEDKHPDYVMYVADNQPKPDSNSNDTGEKTNDIPF